MTHSVRRHQIAIDLCAILLAAAALHVALGLKNATLNAGGLLDTDAYMRLIRVEELWQSGDWYQTVTRKLGAPDGLSLHWTRPLDALILLPAILLNLFGIDAHRAVYLVGIAISPILHTLACIAAAWAAKPLFPQHGAWRMAALILLLSGAALGYSIPGRPDHHPLCILTMAVACGYAIRGLLALENPRPALLAGVWAGLGIWVAPEILLTVGPLLICVAFIWLLSRDGRLWARFGFHFGIGLTLILAGAILVEQPPSNWGTAEYDKVSILHLTIAVTVLLDFGIAAQMPWHGLRKYAAGLTLGVASLALLLMLFPRFYMGSLGNIDSAGSAIFIDEVTEMEPLWPKDFDTAMLLLRFIGNTLIAVPTGLYFLWVSYRRREFAAFLYLLLGYLVVLATAMAHLRLSIAVSVFGAILGCGLFAIICNWAEQRGHMALRIARLVSYFIVAIGVQFVGMIFVSNAGTSDSKSCDPLALAYWLRDARPGISATNPSPIIMSDSINPSPTIAYYTEYRLVGGPYHRGNADVADMLAVFTSTKAEDSLAILQKRKVDLLMVCTKFSMSLIRKSAPDSLYHRLVDGDVPDWLRPIQVSTEVGQTFRLFTVAR